MQMRLPNPEPSGKSKRKHVSYYALFTLIENDMQTKHRGPVCLSTRYQTVSGETLEGCSHGGGQGRAERGLETKRQAKDVRVDL